MTLMEHIRYCRLRSILLNALHSKVFFFYADKFRMGIYFGNKIASRNLIVKKKLFTQKQ